MSQYVAFAAVYCELTVIHWEISVALRNIVIGNLSVHRNAIIFDWNGRGSVTSACTSQHNWESLYYSVCVQAIVNRIYVQLWQPSLFLWLEAFAKFNLRSEDGLATVDARISSIICQKLWNPHVTDKRRVICTAIAVVEPHNIVLCVIYRWSTSMQQCSCSANPAQSLAIQGASKSSTFIRNCMCQFDQLF